MVIHFYSYSIFIPIPTFQTRPTNNRSTRHFLILKIICIKKRENMVNSSNQAVTHPPLDQILFLNYKGRDPSCFSFQTQASDLDTPCLDHGKTEDFPNKHPFKHAMNITIFDHTDQKREEKEKMSSVGMRQQPLKVHTSFTMRRSPSKIPHIS